MANPTPTTPPGGRVTTGTLVTWTAATPPTDQEVDFDSGDILLARNTGGSSRTVTVYSVPTPDTGRTANVSQSLAAGAMRVFGPWSKAGWQQTNRKLKFTASHAEVEFAVIKRGNP